MAESKKIQISVPASLLTEIDRITDKEKTNRSELILQAIRMYLKDRRNRALTVQMKDGYRAMAEINLALAEESVSADDEQFKNYEKRLAEREKK
ncbi:MAG: CopG family ribbon-helix-helix protein [Bacillota bacterium]